LPTTGVVNVRLNQKVNPTDIIGETNWAREHVVIDVARMLKLTPARAERLVRCKVGDRLAAGTVVANGSGLFARSIRTPREGTVVAVGGGQVLMEVGETKVELRAGIPGTVIEVIPNRGAVIQTAGSLVQGVWGNGRVDSGLLYSLMNKADAVLSVSSLDVSLRGSILLAGMVKDVEALESLAELQIRGLIASSIYPSLLPTAREMKYPIIVTEGFGSLPMNSAAYRLLSTNVKRETVVNAEIYNRYSGARPEVIIPLTISSDPPPSQEFAEFAIGLSVRMRRPPAMGSIGVITAVRPGLTTLPSGLRAAAADVKLENEEVVVVPLVNLEVVG